MEKKHYEEAALEIIHFQHQTVLTDSSKGDLGDPDEY